MKTTLDLPDDLVSAVKVRAIQESRNFKDVVADLLKRGLAQDQGAPSPLRSRLKLPLIE